MPFPSPSGKPRLRHAVDLFGEIRILRAVTPEHLLPCAVQVRAARAEVFGEMLAHAFRNHEVLRGIEAEELLGQPHFLLAQRLAVRLGRILLVRRAVADMAVHDDQRRPILVRRKVRIGLLEQVHVVGSVTRRTFQP